MLTLSLCPTCYKKIPAQVIYAQGNAIMVKECDEHGPFSAVMDTAGHVSTFYRRGTRGNNNTIIIHAHNECNMTCSWCYYPMGKEKMQPFGYYHTLLEAAYRGFNLLLSGGEPTLRPDFFEFVREGWHNGWSMSSITNMIKLGDRDFFDRTMSSDFVTGATYRFAMSMQHPKNYNADILEQKVNALRNIERAGLKAMCCMFSITSLDELDYIREFYNASKNCYGMLRIRTMFKNWANKGDTSTLRLSDLHAAFLAKFADLGPVISTRVEESNIYCLYLEMADGMQVSLSSAPTVENIDYHICSRPVFMLARDGRCYPVPIAQIVSEGIDKGWKDGFRLGGELCTLQ